MNSSMINAMVSMNAMQRKIDAIADNVANVDTIGYKRKQSSFEDLLTNVKEQPEAFRQDGRLTPMGYNQGWGARMSMLEINMSQGSIKQTGLSTDIAIQGNALFEVQTDDAGTRAFTRNGAFQLTVRANGDTILATAEGYPVIARVPDQFGNIVEGPIVMPQGHTMRVDPDGTVIAVSDTGATRTLGSIKVLEVMRSAALTPVADNLFVVADGLNRDSVLQQVVPSEENRIALLQGSIEASNVELADEVTELLSVQRAYQLAARALSSSDTMMGLANTMRA